MDRWVDGDGVWIRIDSVHGPLWKQVAVRPRSVAPAVGTALMTAPWRGLWCGCFSWLLEASVVLASIFLVHPLTQTIMAAFGRLGRVLVMRQSTVAIERISYPLCSRCSHLESGALFPCDSVPGSHWFRASGCCLSSTENWILTGDFCLRGCGTWFDSRYMFCDSTLVAMDEFHTFFYDAADSNPEVLLSLLLQNGEVCPVDASGCSFAQRGSHWETWKSFLRASLG